MTLDNHDKIAIGGALALLLAFYFFMSKTATGNSTFSFGGINLPQPSTTVPSWLTNNYNPNFSNAPNLSLPTLSNNGDGKCYTCSLF